MIGVCQGGHNVQCEDPGTLELAQSFRGISKRKLGITLLDEQEAGRKSGGYIKEPNGVESAISK